MEQQEFGAVEIQNAAQKKGITGSTLKLIAIITMLIDHIGASIIESGILNGNMNFLFGSDTQMVTWATIDFVFRMIGRIAFPIFCFLLIEGFLHTRNVKKYALRLLIFCFVSEIPFDLAFFRTFFDFRHQNIYFTLLIGLWVIYMLKRFEGKDRNKRLIQVCSILAGALLANILRTDYGAFGVLFIVIMYIFRNDKKKRALVGGFSICWEITAPLAFVPIHLYNGERGWKVKYVFYLFYPVHLLILGIITNYFF